eukprot:CAMPEP_0197441878 /NCGR_PEP_ID=MMETSP1175-20131217/8024_1 /TAXON_ID=1003142 /ORGANISM="Triceratium dubium, Strain CCMP147" /LENGTH=806 /DNA_ID=CAMNT_0042972237 /DNA_START=44 /DNA_END=2464 /DNA_ORIENTATION=+
MPSHRSLYHPTPSLSSFSTGAIAAAAVALLFIVAFVSVVTYGGNNTAGRRRREDERGLQQCDGQTNRPEGHRDCVVRDRALRDCSVCDRAVRDCALRNPDDRDRAVRDPVAASDVDPVPASDVDPVPAHDSDPVAAPDVDTVRAPNVDPVRDPDVDPVRDPDEDATTDEDFTFEEFIECVCHEFQKAWNRLPYPHQIVAAAQMLSPFRDPNAPPCAFLGEATGRGKSLFELATFTLFGSINICVTPLITLASQQAVVASMRRNQRHGTIHVYHLDLHKEPDQVQHILDRVEECRRHRNITLILFASPEVLTAEDLPWKKSIATWKDLHLLQSHFVDEVHLILEWLYLRPAIANLFHDIFPILFPPDRPEEHIPFCAMTATFSLERMRAFELVSGVRFRNEDILWASPQQMSRRSISLHINIGHYTLSVHGNKIIDLLREDPDARIVCYFNDRHSAINFKTSLCKKLDESGLVNEAPILIHGKLPRDVKAKLIKYFTGDATLPSGRVFRVLIATTGVAGVGIDLSHIKMMTAEGMFQSVGTMAQAFGRMARRTMGPDERDHLYMIPSVESFAYLYKRAYNTERKNKAKMQQPRREREMDAPAMTPQEFCELAIIELFQLMNLIVLNFGCIHGRLETILAKPPSLGGIPFLGPRLGPCRGDCLFCLPDKKRREVYRPVVCPALIRLLIHGFSVKGRMKLCPDMVDFLWNSPGIAKLVYDVKNPKHLFKRQVNGTVLQLLASRMLKESVQWNQDEKSFDTFVELAHTDEMPHVSVNANTHPAGRFYCELDEAWRGIETKEATLTQSSDN